MERRLQALEDGLRDQRQSTLQQNELINNVLVQLSTVAAQLHALTGPIVQQVTPMVESIDEDSSSGSIQSDTPSSSAKHQRIEWSIWYIQLSIHFFLSQFSMKYLFMNTVTFYNGEIKEVFGIIHSRIMI
jgi:hypothetical protein